MARRNQTQGNRRQGDSSKQRKIRHLEEMLSKNAVATKTVPNKKVWTKHDMKHIRPLTQTQADMFEVYNEGYHVTAVGSAGTGKTFLALTLALSSILENDSLQSKIIVVRSVVPSRDIGFLPGTAEEKVSVYEQPYRDILKDLFGRDSTYDNMKEEGLIEFVPTSFIRGITWDDAVIVVDEAQNMTDMELHSIMTRVGENTRIVVCGDTKQNDLGGKRNSEQSGFETFMQVVAKMPTIQTIQFSREDIVRSAFVRDWICTREDIDLA